MILMKTFPGFDPFTDRLARDIRNSLSTALVAGLESGGIAGVMETAADWLGQDLAPQYQAYIVHCKKCYQAVIETIKAQKVNDPYGQAIILWNRSLFFELHELLETVWQKAPEPLHTALKGLIQAAGAYVHRQRNHCTGAEALAQKARRNLRSAATALDFIVNNNELIDALVDITQPPPILHSKKGRQPPTRMAPTK